MISFVLATRNDGYGGELAGVGNFAMRRLEITVSSILRLRCELEIVVVEWNPPPGRPRLAEVLAGLPVRIITISPELQALLDADNPGRRLGFYEYAAKDIGIRQARSEYIIACNPDNIFPAAEFLRAVAGLAGDVLVRADRKEIAADNAATGIEQLLDLADAGRLEVTGVYKGAGGDFCGFTRATYFRVGGFLAVHGNRGVDTEFQQRARKAGVAVLQEYVHYHIHHENAVREAAGRPLGVGACSPIRPEIARSWDQFASEAS